MLVKVYDAMSNSASANSKLHVTLSTVTAGRASDLMSYKIMRYPQLTLHMSDTTFKSSFRFDHRVFVRSSS